MKSFQERAGIDEWGANAKQALDALAMKPTRGIPHWLVHVMEIPELEHFAGVAPGEYRRNVGEVYLQFQRNIGTAYIDQYIPDNPLSMGSAGYEDDTPRGATTGAEEVVWDGIRIDSAEAVAEHMERFVFPSLAEQIAACEPEDPDAPDRIVQGEADVQRVFGPDIAKVYYGASIPGVRYGMYGYVHYFEAYALYPELMERDFALQGELCAKRNVPLARAMVEGDLPRAIRLDMDIADSRGTLMDIRSLEKIYFPPLAEAIKPLVDAGVRLLWHCDGNIMDLVEPLIEAGVGGFQGFQYEDGVDYEKICKMTDRDGGPLMIWAGVSVTRALPMGTPDDVRDQLRWLVRHGPPVGLCLACSSSVAPGVKRENLETLIEGLQYYQEHGRDGA